MSYANTKSIVLYLLLAAQPIAQSAAEDSKLTYEVESLLPIYLYNGYHIAGGIKYEDYRFRVSCIDGGHYDYEPNNKTFERNLGKGCGIFAGYFLDDNWHVYAYIENQSYIVTKRSSGISSEIDVVDLGGGIGYQYFLTSNLYVQPALHLYWRDSESIVVDGSNYTLRHTDVSPTLRVGFRF